MTGHRKHRPHEFGAHSGHVDRAHAEAFAEALDGLEGSSAGSLDDDAEMLLVIVDRLHGLPGTVALADAGPRPEFRTQLRERLLDEAHDLADDETARRVVPITSRWTQSWGRRNRTRLVSGLAAGIVGLTAVSVAAANSLPGSPFYNLKRDSESLRYAVAGSDEARGKLELGFARTRLHEIDRMTQHDAAWGVAPVNTPQAAGPTDTTILATSLNSRVLRLFSDMDHEAAKGSALLALSFKNDPRPGPILAVQKFARDQERALATLTPRLSGSALNSAAHSLVWAKAVVTTAAMVLKSCGTTTCSKAGIAHLTGPLAPTPSSPVLPANVTPSASPSGVPSLTSPTTTPSQAVQPPVVAPSAPAPTSPQPTQGQQPPATPTTTGNQPAPTDTGGQPTAAPTTQPPTTAPPTTPTTPTTDGPTPPPTTEPPTTATPSTTPTTVPTTVPPPSAVDTPSPPPTEPPPPPSSAAPVPSTTPAPTTPVPSTTPPPPSSPATTSPAPTTPAPTTAAPTTTDGPPPIICLPPLKLVGTICIRPGRGPIHD